MKKLMFKDLKKDLKKIQVENEPSNPGVVRRGWNGLSNLVRELFAGGDVDPVLQSSEEVILLLQLNEEDPNFGLLFSRLARMSSEKRGATLEQVRSLSEQGSEGSGLVVLLTRLHDSNRFEMVFRAVQQLSRKPIVFLGREFGRLEFVVLVGALLVLVVSLSVCFVRIKL